MFTIPLARIRRIARSLRGRRIEADFDPLTRPTGRGVKLLVAVSIVSLVGCGGSPRSEDEASADVITRLPDASDRVSQPAEVRQRMGETEIIVVYNRPSARGRELFGALVPYDSVWNPGADEATRIEVSRDILVEGESLPAGRYSVWAIPRPTEWTVIFSRAWNVEHIPYPEGEDELRLQVRPRRAMHLETLGFYFPVAAQDSVELNFHWGNAVLPFRIRSPD